MGFKIDIKRTKASAQEKKPYTEKNLEIDPEWQDSRFHVKAIKRASPDDIPNFMCEMHGLKVRLYLVANNDVTRTYAVYASGWWIGNLLTAGHEHAACKVTVPSDYANIASAPKFTPTGVNMGDGIGLLMKAADIIPNTPKAPNHKAKVKIRTD
ncbi:hypothetical protein [Vibrio phage vB_VhaS-a]|nr:hypothetical protein [Vibrio phage vB_VhaS-a]